MKRLSARDTDVCWGGGVEYIKELFTAREITMYYDVNGSSEIQ